MSIRDIEYDSASKAIIHTDVVDVRLGVAVPVGPDGADHAALAVGSFPGENGCSCGPGARMNPGLPHELMLPITGEEGAGYPPAASSSALALPASDLRTLRARLDSVTV